MANIEALGKLMHSVNKQISDCSEMFKSLELLSEADPHKDFLNKEEAVSLIEEFNTHLVDISCCIEKQNLEYEARAQRLNNLASELEEESEKLIKNVTDLEEKFKPFGLKCDQPEMLNQPIFEKPKIIVEDVTIDALTKVIDNGKLENLKTTSDEAAFSDVRVIINPFTPESPKCTANVEERNRLMRDMDFSKNMASLKSETIKSIVRNTTPDSPEPTSSYFTPQNQKKSLFKDDETPKTPELTTTYNFRHTQLYVPASQPSEIKYKVPMQVGITKIMEDSQVKPVNQQKAEPVNRVMLNPDTLESPISKINLDETKESLPLSKSNHSQTPICKFDSSQKDIFGRNDETPKTPEITSKYYAFKF